MQLSGREEKKVAVTAGAAVTAVQWSSDGTAIVTGGEDGAVKVWSAAGMLRSTLAQTEFPVYAAAWGPDNDRVAFAAGDKVFIKSLSTDRRQMAWKAHQGVVLSLDWNAVTGLIVTGGEDCKYKVWDAFGKPLFASSPLDNVVTAVKWRPDGAAFVAGAYNTLRLCDRTGWSHSRESPEMGSVYSVAFSPDGTQLVAGGGSGTVITASLVEVREAWGSVEATLVDPTTITVTDVFTEASENLDFRGDRVTHMALGFGHLVVTTATQCYVHSASNWHSPHIFDLRGRASLVVLSARQFLLVDSVAGVQVYSYEGRAGGNPKFAGLRPEALSGEALALAADSVAVIDSADARAVHVFETRTGRGLPGAFKHSCEVTEVALSQGGSGLQERYLAFVDTNKELFITPVTNPRIEKLTGMVDSIAWCSSCDVLVALADGDMVTWQHPAAAFVDRDLLAAGCERQPQPAFGKLPSITAYDESRVTVQRGDGAVITATAALHGPMLHSFVRSGDWQSALRLARFVKAQPLWAALASMAITAKHLDAAEVSLAALGDVAKLVYLQYIKEIPSPEGRNAEMALYRKEPPQVAEDILLQASPPLVYRAIKLNTRLYRWERALAIAERFGEHLDTVRGYRQRHLDATHREEHLSAFLKYADRGPVDWSAIQAAKAASKQAEASQSGAAARGGGGGGGKADD